MRENACAAVEHGRCKYIDNSQEPFFDDALSILACQRGRLLLLEKSTKPFDSVFWGLPWVSAVQHVCASSVVTLFCHCCSFAQAFCKVQCWSAGIHAKQRISGLFFFFFDWTTAPQRAWVWITDLESLCYRTAPITPITQSTPWRVSSICRYVWHENVSACIGNTLQSKCTK